MSILLKIKKLIEKVFNFEIVELDNLVNYIFTAESLPEPLSTDKEFELVNKYQQNNDASAKAELIEHNLRLVMYIAKKFENNKLDMQDLVSVGTIGLIKAVHCIENEILMYLRKANKSINDLSLDDTLVNDEEGNNLTLGEIIPDDKKAYDEIELADEKTYLLQAISLLNEREKRIMCMRYGLNGYDEMTQKEVADSMNISQSYISRLEKKILHKLKRDMSKNM